LTDEDFRALIVTGVLRREPLIDFIAVRDTPVQGRPDPDVLQYAEDEGLIVLTHDVNTMTRHAFDRLAAGRSFPGVFVVRQRMPVRAAIENIIQVWADGNADGWRDSVNYLPIRMGT
jgi:uncharacterized protein DUF5615